MSNTSDIYIDLTDWGRLRDTGRDDETEISKECEIDWGRLKVENSDSQTVRETHKYCKGLTDWGAVTYTGRDNWDSQSDSRGITIQFKTKNTHSISTVG